MQTIRENFGLSVRYAAVTHMARFVSTVDSPAGVDIYLECDIGGYPAGAHHRNGSDALAVARERSSGDDFSRMVRAQILLSTIFREAILPTHWSVLPRFLYSLTQVIETYIPLRQWPRLLRGLLFGIDCQTITREMVIPFKLHKLPKSLRQIGMQLILY